MGGWAGIAIALLLGLVTAGALVIWRIWPVLVGGVRPLDGPETRIRKWNRHLVPLLRRMLKGKAAVGRVGSFPSAATRQLQSIGTWSLQKTIIPEVDYIAIARPGVQPPEILGVAEAPVLRTLLGLEDQRQDLWGHVAYLYAWPATADLEAIVARLTPFDEFRERHAWTPKEPTA